MDNLVVILKTRSQIKEMIMKFKALNDYDYTDTVFPVSKEPITKNVVGATTKVVDGLTLGMFGLKKGAE